MEDGRINRSDVRMMTEDIAREIKGEGSQNRDAKSRKAVKAHNGMSDEQLKLNNNFEEGDLGRIENCETPESLSNGSETWKPDVSDVRFDSVPANGDLATNANEISMAERTKIVAIANVTPSLGAKCKTRGTGTIDERSSASTHSGAKTRVSSCAVHSSAVRPHLSTEDTDMRKNVDNDSGMDKCPPKGSRRTDSSPDLDSTQRASSYSAALRTANDIVGSVGSTSRGTCRFSWHDINAGREFAGSGGSPQQKISPQRPNERRDSSSGNEGDTSDGEEYCIYTYKGSDEPTDLARQRFDRNGQDEEERAAGERYHSGRSSPEMDFLEMDFDPGPSCEQDTGDSDLASINEDIQNIALDGVEADPAVLNDLSGGRVLAVGGAPREGAAAIQQSGRDEDRDDAGTSRGDDQRPSQSSLSYLRTPSTSAGLASWETSDSSYRGKVCPLRESYGHHNTSGDLISPGDNRDADSELWADSTTAPVPANSHLDSRKINLSSTLYHRMMAKKLMLDKQAAFNRSGDSNLEGELCDDRSGGCASVEKVMLWNEQEATVKQITQIATSACGATAAINALLALDVSFSLEVLIRGVATRSREPGTPLPRYLTSRSRAGATHEDLARGLSLATSGAVISKFFAFYPERKVSLSRWLHYWISRGAAPIATLNLQHCGEGRDIPDAWHHQMIFGVGPAGIYLTNPVQCLPERVVWHQLVSPGVLLVRRADVLAHWNSATDLIPLALLDQNWRKLNVLGQVVNMIREATGNKHQRRATTNFTTHIRIPASYRAGITLVMRSESPAAAELLSADQLPPL